MALIERLPKKCKERESEIMTAHIETWSKISAWQEELDARRLLVAPLMARRSRYMMAILRIWPLIRPSLPAIIATYPGSRTTRAPTTERLRETRRLTFEDKMNRYQCIVCYPNWKTERATSEPNDGANVHIVHITKQRLSRSANQLDFGGRMFAWTLSISSSLVALPLGNSPRYCVRISKISDHRVNLYSTE